MVAIEGGDRSTSIIFSCEFACLTEVQPQPIWSWSLYHSRYISSVLFHELAVTQPCQKGIVSKSAILRHNIWSQSFIGKAASSSMADVYTVVIPGSSTSADHLWLGKSKREATASILLAKRVLANRVCQCTKAERHIEEKTLSASSHYTRYEKKGKVYCSTPCGVLTGASGCVQQQPDAKLQKDLESAQDSIDVQQSFVNTKWSSVIGKVSTATPWGKSLSTRHVMYLQHCPKR